MNNDASYDLGVRTISYKRQDRSFGSIHLTLRVLNTEPNYDEDSPATLGFGARVTIRSDIVNWDHDFYGQDTIQALFRCLWLSDIYLQQVCRDNQIEIFSQKPGDIERDFDVYRA